MVVTRLAYGLLDVLWRSICSLNSVFDAQIDQEKTLNDRTMNNLLQYKRKVTIAWLASICKTWYNNLESASNTLFDIQKAIGNVHQNEVAYEI